VLGLKKPLYEGHLLDRDIHISDIDVPENSTWAGHGLAELRLSNRFGVHVSSILRGHQRINIPGGDAIIFPGDRLQVIGSDSQLAAVQAAIDGDIVPEDPNIEKREMRLSQIVIDRHSPFVGKTLPETGIRNQYDCMVVGREEGKENLSMVNTTYRLKLGDIIWIVGEEEAIQHLTEANKGAKRQ
ncbi:TrkA C-terminal domain-containing protein, partial [Prevotella sp.]